MKFLLAFAAIIAMLQQVKAETIDCILIKKGDKILAQEGKDCDTQYSPNSTFKIPLAVMGFESKILKTRHTPVWKPEKPVTFLKEFHDGEQSPTTWMTFSMPWYSQILTKKMGMQKFKNYIEKMQYGNMDLSGDDGKNNGLTESWLSSSLKISPRQQLEFIEKLAKNELNFSKESQNKAKDIMKSLHETSACNSWLFHGKTGSTDFDKINIRQGYFVGFATKNNQIISFVIHISGKIGDKSAKTGGLQARKMLVEKMIKDGVFND